MKNLLATITLCAIVGCSNSPSESGVNETLRKFIGGTTIVSDILNINCAYTDEGYISEDATKFTTLDNHIFKVVNSSENAISYFSIYGSPDPVRLTWKLTEITASGGKIEMLNEYEGCPPGSEYGTFTFK
ncbi:MAG: hypothetical protein ACRCV0_02325 [Brevinema sp.]